MKPRAQTRTIFSSPDSRLFTEDLAGVGRREGKLHFFWGSWPLRKLLRLLREPVCKWSSPVLEIGHYGQNTRISTSYESNYIRALSVDSNVRLSWALKDEHTIRPLGSSEMPTTVKNNILTDDNGGKLHGRWSRVNTGDVTAECILERRRYIARDNK